MSTALNPRSFLKSLSKEVTPSLFQNILIVTYIHTHIYVTYTCMYICVYIYAFYDSFPISDKLCAIIVEND